MPRAITQRGFIFLHCREDQQTYPVVCVPACIHARLTEQMTLRTKIRHSLLPRRPSRVRGEHLLVRRARDPRGEWSRRPRRADSRRHQRLLCREQPALHYRLGDMRAGGRGAGTAGESRLRVIPLHFTLPLLCLAFFGTSHSQDGESHFRESIGSRT